MNPSVLFQEINEQPGALARFLDAEAANVQRIAAEINRRKPTYITIAARGTSDNAATFAKYVFASFNGLPVALATPSLYSIYHTPPRLTDSLVIAISQSGESPDILAVVEEAKHQHTRTLAMTNSAGSPLARAADMVILQHAGEEKTIAATKTYTTQLAALALLSIMLADDRVRRRELQAAPAAVAGALSLDSLVEQAARQREMHMCLVIGRGYNYATAFEIALKLKELAYVTAEPFSSADFMHGPFALIQGGFPVILIAPRGRVCDDLIAVSSQLKSRGADLIVVSDSPEALALADSPLTLPVSQPEWLSPLTAVIPGQLLAYHLTAAKGYDPDHPRGLTKVTRTL